MPKFKIQDILSNFQTMVDNLSFLGWLLQCNVPSNFPFIADDGLGRGHSF